MKIIKLIMGVLMVSCLLGSQSNAVYAGQVQVKVENVWVKAVPPSLKHTAAYMTLQNESDKDEILVRVISQVAETVEMHKMETVDGVMKMEPVEQIIVPQKGQVELKPGGLHIMLIGLKEKLQEGAFVPLVLEFKDGTKTEILAIVKRMGMGGDVMKGSQMKGSDTKGSQMKGSMQHDQ